MALKAAPPVEAARTISRTRSWDAKLFVQDVNPATGQQESKHAWLISHDGTTSGSVWYHDDQG